MTLSKNIPPELGDEFQASVRVRQLQRQTLDQELSHLSLVYVITPIAAHDFKV